MKNNQTIQGRWYKINKKVKKRIKAKYHKIKDWVMDPKGYFLIAIDRKKKIIKAILEYNGPIQAPIKKGDKLAVLNIYVSDELKKQIDLFSYEDVKRKNIFSRLFTSLNYLVWGDV